jgi:hypothetical protein
MTRSGVIAKKIAFLGLAERDQLAWRQRFDPSMDAVPTRFRTERAAPRASSTCR